MSVLVRVSPETDDQLRCLAEARNVLIGQVLAHTAERLDPESFWADIAAAYAWLRADPEAWSEGMDEIREWDVAMLDGAILRRPGRGVSVGLGR